MTLDPASLDRRIGERIRLRRTELGLTQEQLASALGISYQQVQKYENGVNRISASRLAEIAQKLEVPIGWFVEEPEEAEPGDPAKPLARARGVLELARGFGALRTQGVRSALVALVRTLAERRL